MNWWQAIVFGIVQGLTEFLPVSSSGHLLIAEKLMGISGQDLLTFYSLLHVGTLAAVLIVMRKDIWAILKNILGKTTWLLLIATIPAVFFALVFKDLIDKAFGGATLGFEFLFTGLLLLAILLFKNGEKTIEKMTWLDAVLAGIGQAVAILPAVSRSGACLFALLSRKVKREDAIRFTFLMSIPAILGSLALDIKDMITGSSTITSGMILPVTLGIVFSAVSGYAVMRFMLKKLSLKGIAICGAYVVVLGVLILVDQNVTHVLL